MNKLAFFLSGFMALSTLAACSDDDNNYEGRVSNLTAEAREGAIQLSWDVPEDPDFMYVKIQYYNVRQKKDFTCTASAYANTFLADGLLARDGEYTFRLTAIGNNGGTGEVVETTCTPLPVQPVVTEKTKELEEVEMVMDLPRTPWTNAQEPSEGPLKNLFDDDTSTFFHSPWSFSQDYPQWIEFEATEAVNGVQVLTNNRGNGSKGGSPDHVQILASNDRENWTEVYEFFGSEDIPDKAQYQSPVINCGETKYKYFRYNVLSSNAGGNWWNLSEMKWKFYEVTRTVYDPENEED